VTGSRLLDLIIHTIVGAIVAVGWYLILGARIGGMS
jgi:hypothetical protein